MKALFNFFIFLFLLILSCRSQTSNELTKQTPIDDKDSLTTEYYKILDGLKHDYVLYYKNLKQINTDLKVFGLPTEYSVFMKDSILYYEYYDKFFNQDYSFIDWFLSFKNDTTKSGLWQKYHNPISSYLGECNLGLTNSRAAIILIENFLNGKGFECYECRHLDSECNTKKYNEIEDFINNNRDKDINGLRIEWKKNAR